MKKPHWSNACKKDIKRMEKRGRDGTRFDEIVRLLLRGERMPVSARVHLLQGKWRGHWECHIEPDWLLVYRVTENEVGFARTGTHADLFE